MDAASLTKAIMAGGGKATLKTVPLGKNRPRTKRFGVAFGQERAWITFYQRVARDVTIATEVLAQLWQRWRSDALEQQHDGCL